jgi:peptide chain release factor
MDTHIIQISSGRGPAECCLAVALALREILQEAREQQIACEVIDRNPGQEKGTLVSALVRLEGKNSVQFCAGWTGALLWIAQSPYRKFHKRKNWFIGIEKYDTASSGQWDAKEVRYQTLRASGPGGQNVNKVETAVRAIHVPTGLQVVASDSRSQLQNKKLATARLEQQYAEWQLKDVKNNQQQQWEQHDALQRGNPVRTYTGSAFKRT